MPPPDYVGDHIVIDPYKNIILTSYCLTVVSQTTTHDSRYRQFFLVHINDQPSPPNRHNTQSVNHQSRNHTFCLNNQLLGRPFLPHHRHHHGCLSSVPFPPPRPSWTLKNGRAQFYPSILSSENNIKQRRRINRPSPFDTPSAATTVLCNTQLLLPIYNNTLPCQLTIWPSASHLLALASSPLSSTSCVTSLPLLPHLPLTKHESRLTPP
jgi:hypothetical protein